MTATVDPLTIEIEVMEARLDMLLLTSDEAAATVADLLAEEARQDADDLAEQAREAEQARREVEAARATMELKQRKREEYYVKNLGYAERWVEHKRELLDAHDAETAEMSRIGLRLIPTGFRRFRSRDAQRELLVSEVEQAQRELDAVIATGPTVDPPLAQPAWVTRGSGRGRRPVRT